MNKSALKTFATSARNELLKKVEAKAMKIGITEDTIKKADIESSDAIFIDGKQLSKEEKIQRDKLIARISQIGFKQVMEEVSYTWFNRFTALRFMEVNDYLPTGVRVLSSLNPNSADPDMLNEALELDLEIDKEYVYELKLNNKTEELFKYLIIKHCNDLNQSLPFMFETIDDYSETLFPEGLLAKDSIIRQMTDVEVFPEESWEKVEIIGWLYQYYISEKKDQVFTDLKKNIKISKENLPAATQIFTPNWIVKYMVENSLGRLWLESYPQSSLKSSMKYYLDETEQVEEVIKQLEEIRNKNVNPEEITFLDPSCGSGHILVYAFDIFFEMYLEKGYIKNEIPKLILEKNLFGMDIDNRAVQLASFAVMMKAREKSRRVFDQEIKLNICAIQESNWVTEDIIAVLVDKEAQQDTQIEQKTILKDIVDIFFDAKEYGSALDVKPLGIEFLEKKLERLYGDQFTEGQGDLLEQIAIIEILDKLPNILLQIKILGNKYDVVCTNPPYMSSSGMENKLLNYLKKKFPNTKSDLSTVFMEKTLEMCKDTGIMSMLNIPAWMFLSSYDQLREQLITDKTFINMLHFGRGVFGSDFGTTAFVIRNKSIPKYKAVYRRLFEKQGSVDNLEQKREWFFGNFGYFTAEKEKFSRLPGMPIAYWVSENVSNLFENNEKLSSFAEPRQGLATGNDSIFLRSWHEVNYSNIGIGYRDKESLWEDNKKYAPFNKGGAFRRWYGNNEIIIKFDSENYSKLLNSGNHLPSRSYYFKKGVTWTALTSYDFSGRYCNEGYVFAGKGPMCFPNNNNDIFYLTGLLNSKLTNYFMGIFSMTMDFTQGTLRNVPIVKVKDKSKIDSLAKNCIAISQNDWDSFETSWDFKIHSLLKYKTLSIEDAYNQWVIDTDNQFSKLKGNEEELNRIFIEIYGLQNELTPGVEDKDVTVRKADRERDIKSFISYAVGCMFGRYSLDKEGIIYAGGNFDSEMYKTFEVETDNIISILPGAYFENDIVAKFVDFVKTTFGEDNLTENLEFIADTIGKKKGETVKETINRYFLTDFYKDHLKTFKKKPFYWLFTSGKEKAFNCLIYMHRYDKTTLSRIRTDYLHEYQIRIDAEKKDLLSIIEGDYSTKEISNAKKELKTLDKKIEELKEYDELLHHMADMQIEIDLDEGVAANYGKFKGLVAKI